MVGLTWGLIEEGKLFLLTIVLSGGGLIRRLTGVQKMIEEDKSMGHDERRAGQRPLVSLIWRRVIFAPRKQDFVRFTARQ